MINVTGAASELKAWLKQKTDSDWELFATAAGNPASVERTLKSLSANEISLGWHSSFAGSPPLIIDRVEALAAYDVNLLSELVMDWIDPSDIASSPWRDWWFCAWQSSLRHLKFLNAANLQAFLGSDLQNEVDVLWGSENKTLSWRELASKINNIVLAFNLIRKQARFDLLENFISSSDLHDISPLMFRRLRGYSKKLDASARDAVLRVGRDCFNRLNNEFALEIAITLDPKIVDEIAFDVLNRLQMSRLPPPQNSLDVALISIVYIVLGNWETP